MQTAPVGTVQSEQTPIDEYAQPSLKGKSRETAIRAYIENVRRDPQYEWKMPIRFYGKVVDEYGNRVVGASVLLQWVTLQGSEGVSAAKASTDAKGLFALENAKGKTLSVRITKQGYYDLSRRENQTSFEYANPAEKSFYEPNVNSPAIFPMRKRCNPEHLLVRRLKFDLSGQGTTATVDLQTGQVSPAGGQLQVTVWKPTIRSCK